MTTQQPVRHIVSLSGGKDSTALAIYLRDRIPNLEYVFCDTGEELPETYEYLDKLEAILGKRIEKLNPERPFRHYLEVYRGVLPDARTRWCTRKLKIEPFERYVGDDLVYNYIGIRADEPHRKGYISTKPNIVPKYPFIEDGIVREDVFRILEESGLGLPKYYEWRSRSGCYFCFFQQRIEWIGLAQKHPDKFQRAVEMEKYNPETGESYTWVPGESLRDLIKPERAEEIKAHSQSRPTSLEKAAPNTPLSKIFKANIYDDLGDDSCLICHL
ncbi:3'-phosphoadenosine 5'-phosphosulfate sulfotransferase [Anaerolinea thermolimosa]|uniref:3'-phosphoadenosine 5'-phosphosulfate sulfotransferase n=1 Tax=Anaerolinea thermolimosa TaxID=229919 RepID=A0A7U9KMQ8_9CHLR|nr:phosphoadenosine phosphosulfate reductase family protein [Anaerolinea thermolimosa]GAP08694.1 3'-phosphoadenosine 5'-phosphosulfate sulfotransferase [Anaerolinea thermolimosa]